MEFGTKEPNWMIIQRRTLELSGCCIVHVFGLNKHARRDKRNKKRHFYVNDKMSWISNAYMKKVFSHVIAIGKRQSKQPTNHDGEMYHDFDHFLDPSQLHHLHTWTVAAGEQVSRSVLYDRRVQYSFLSHRRRTEASEETSMHRSAHFHEDFFPGLCRGSASYQWI